jgi:hypothetical protein
MLFLVNEKIQIRSGIWIRTNTMVSSERLRKVTDPTDRIRNFGYFRLIMLLFAGGDLFERVSKSEYRLTEAKCQIFMRQILRDTFQYPYSASVVFFIASLFYTFMTSFHKKIP